MKTNRARADRSATRLSVHFPLSPMRLRHTHQIVGGQHTHKRVSSLSSNNLPPPTRILHSFRLLHSRMGWRTGVHTDSESFDESEFVCNPIDKNSPLHLGCSSPFFFFLLFPLTNQVVRYNTENRSNNPSSFLLSVPSASTNALDGSPPPPSPRTSASLDVTVHT